MGKQWKQWGTLFILIYLGSKIIADGDCNHEIKNIFLLGRKAKRNLESILKSKNFVLPTKVHIIRAMICPLVTYGCESWTIKKTECWRTDAFKLWCCRRLLRVLWITRRSNKLMLKEINSDFLWKDWCWSWSSNTLITLCKEPTHWKRPWCCERLRARGEGDNRGWDGWMASPTQWTQVWASSRRWWRTGKFGGLQSVGSQSKTWLSDRRITTRTRTGSSQICFILLPPSYFASNNHSLGVILVRQSVPII